MDYLPADYIQLEMCTLLHNTTDCASKCTLYKCIRVTQEANHHVVHVNHYVQITTASCKKGSFKVCLFSTNFSALNRHTSTDFKDIFTDHVT